MLANEQYPVHRGRYGALPWLGTIKGGRKSRMYINPDRYTDKKANHNGIMFDSAAFDATPSFAHSHQPCSPPTGTCTLGLRFSLPDSDAGTIRYKCIGSLEPFHENSPPGFIANACCRGRFGTTRLDGPGYLGNFVEVAHLLILRHSSQAPDL